jgi:hypothetical protein
MHPSHSSSLLARSNDYGTAMVFSFIIDDDHGVHEIIMAINVTQDVTSHNLLYFIAMFVPITPLLINQNQYMKEKGAGEWQDLLNYRQFGLEKSYVMLNFTYPDVSQQSLYCWDRRVCISGGKRNMLGNDWILNYRHFGLEKSYVMLNFTYPDVSQQSLFCWDRRVCISGGKRNMLGNGWILNYRHFGLEKSYVMLNFTDPDNA